MIHLITNGGTHVRLIVHPWTGVTTIRMQDFLVEYPSLKRALFILGGMVDWDLWTSASKDQLIEINGGAI